MSVTFPVDEVEPARDRLPEAPLGERYARARAFGGDPAAPVIDHAGTHPLLAAVGIAFAQHRPLVLSPDAVWLTIAQGVAQHVRLHAEALRGRLVRHDGRRRLTLERDALPRDPAEWSSIVGDLRELLAREIGDGRARLLECDFSTTTDVDHIASQIVLLDAYSPYFSYWLSCVCGIPEITLLGTAGDWRRIRERVDVIAELDLERWCRSLRPITEQFARAAAGDVDVAFWKRIYNPSDAYGGQSITGWITRLWPYLHREGAVDRPNPMLELPIDEPKQETVGVLETRTFYDGLGVSSNAVPATRSRATLRIVNRDTRTLGAVELVAGVSAVVQDARGALMPIASWHVEDATLQIADVIAKIVARHPVVRPEPGEDRPRPGGPAEVVELFDQIERATLFAGERAWRFQTAVDAYFKDQDGIPWSFQRIAFLPGGTSLCGATRWRGERETRYVLCQLDERVSLGPDDPVTAVIVDEPSQMPLLAGSLAQILDAALDTGGDISHLVVGRFADLLA